MAWTIFPAIDIFAIETAHATAGNRSTTRSRAVSGGWLAVCCVIAAGGHWMLASGFANGAPHPMIVLAMLAIAAGWWRTPPAAPTRADWWCFFIALLICLAPFRSAAVVSLACAGAIFWPRGGVDARCSAALMFALVGWGLKDGVWAGFASAPVLWIEAHVVAGLLGAGGVGAVAHGNHLELADGHQFIVLRACSVLALAYPCAIGTFAFSRLLRPALSPGAARIGLALGLLALLNTARLTAMAASPAIYDSLHGESGALPLQLMWGVIVFAAAAIPSRST